MPSSLRPPVHGAAFDVRSSMESVPLEGPSSPASSALTLATTGSTAPLVPRRRLDSAASRAASAVPGASQRESLPRRIAMTGPDEPVAVDVAINLPTPCSGVVARGLDGRLRCGEDHGVESVLALLRRMSPDTVDGLSFPAAGARVTVDWDDDVMPKMGRFLHLAHGDIVLATDLLRDAIHLGRAAFAPGAAVPGTTLAPIDFLATIRPRLRVDGEPLIEQELQRLVTPAGVPDLRLQKFREDFGAVSLLALANDKDFNGKLVYALGASLGGTGLIGASFDYGIWPQARKTMSPARVAAAGPLLDSLTPLVAETFDSMVIKRLMEAMKGGSLLPDSARQALDDLKDAAFAGAIAALGSVPNNYVREKAMQMKERGNHPGAIALLVAKQFTNLFATWTSGAIVPLDVTHAHQALVDAKMALIEAGVAARPDVPDVRAHVRESAMRTIRAARGTGTNVRSMATGGELAATIGLLTSLLEFYGVISPTLEQLVTLMYSTPIEVLSMMSTMAGERWIGQGGGAPGASVTTDAGKQSALLARIASHPQTTLDDLDRIARPPGEWNAQAGYAITQALGTVMEYIETGAASGQQWLSRAAARMATSLRALAPGRREPPAPITGIEMA